MRQFSRLVLGLAVFGGLFWLLTLIPIHPPRSGSPFRNQSPEQEAETARRVALDEQERHRWLDRVESGEASFAEAACVYERHGWWEEGDGTCDESFDARLHPGARREASGNHH